jgi:hypothetical protein
MAIEDYDRVIASIVRFIPGAILGFAVGFWLVVAVNTPVLFFGGIAGCTLLGGLLSARFGLRFWEALRHLRWFPF